MLAEVDLAKFLIQLSSFHNERLWTWTWYVHVSCKLLFGFFMPSFLIAITLLFNSQVVAAVTVVAVEVAVAEGKAQRLM